MKKIITLLVLFLAGPVYSQWSMIETVNFDGATPYDYTVTVEPGSQWQIGPPQKTALSIAESSPNVIITHTVNAYPPNDTSVFTVKHRAGPGFTTPHTVAIEGWYQVSSGLADSGRIEFSPDNGTTWVDLLHPGAYSAYVWWNTQPPVLRGSSAGWQYFHVTFPQLGPLFNIQMGDTVLYRFSFISDSINGGEEGLMYDSFVFQDYIEGIEEHRQSAIPTRLSPVPVVSTLRIDYENTAGAEHLLCVFNQLGEVVIRRTLPASLTGIDLDLSALPAGVYSLKLLNTLTQQMATPRFIKTP
jgi:hypothetical protein